MPIANVLGALDRVALGIYVKPGESVADSCILPCTPYHLIDPHLSIKRYMYKLAIVVEIDRGKLMSGVVAVDQHSSQWRSIHTRKPKVNIGDSIEVRNFQNCTCEIY